MKVIIDTDMMIDDWMAILYLCANPSVEVIGISVTGTGGAYLTPGSRNALALLKIFNRDTNIPVVAGSETPLVYSNLYPTHFRKNANDFMGLKIPASDAPLSKKNVVDFYNDLLNAQTEKVTILAIGGGSNLGNWLKDPNTTDLIKAKVSNIVVMGGAIKAAGNLSDLSDLYPFNTVAEWNVFIDVLGMEYIVSGAINVILVPLDACNEVKLGKSFVDEFKTKTKGTPAEYMAQMLALYLSSATEDFPFFDVFAASVLSTIGTPDFNALVTTQKLNVSVTQKMKTSGAEDTAGQTLVSPEGKATDVCMSAQVEEFKKLLIAPFA